MVDVTNYAMLELAQPTHAFDGNRLKAIRVAKMGREGTFTTLDGQERKMLPERPLDLEREGAGGLGRGNGAA